MKTLKRTINEVVRQVLLAEAKSIKSRRLQEIISKHGGLGRHGNNTYDLHNMKDDDIICVLPANEYHALYDKRYDVDHWRWADNYSLEVWAKNQGIKLKRGDRIGALELKDGYYLLFINSNESCVPERGGWKDYYDKREERSRNRYMDGKNRYIPKHRRPFDYDRVWKNPYRKDWKKDDVDNMMQNIRDYNMDIERPTNY